MKLWPFAKKSMPDTSVMQESKTVEAALFDLAMVCALPQEPYVTLFVSSGLKVHSPEHFAIAREATAYVGGLLWLRLKGEMPRGDQEDRVGDLAGNVAKVHCHLMREKGISQSEIDSQVDPDMNFAIEKIAEYEKVGRDPLALLQHFQSSLRSVPILSKYSQIVPALAKAFELAFDRWTIANPNVFLPSAISAEVLAEYGLSYREAVDVSAEYGEVFADLNDAWVTFKPESRLPTNRQTIKAAMKLSLQGDQKMTEQIRDAHDFMYPQLALFVPDSDAQRAIAFCERPNVEFIGGHERKGLDPIKMSVRFFGTPQILSEDQFYEGLEFFGKEFFNSQHFEGRDSADARFMRSLAIRCWRDMWTLVREWREFVNAHGL